MEFCEKCGGKLKTTIKEEEPHLKCGSCGEIRKLNNREDFVKKVFITNLQGDSEIRIEDGISKAFGDIVRHECKNCPSTEAYFQEIKPNRFNDEQSVALYKCVRCKKVERSKTAG